MMTHRIQYLRKKGLDTKVSYGIDDLSKISGLPTIALQQIYLRGLGAYNTQLSSVRLKKDFSKNSDTKRFPASMRLSPQQWAMARIYSFLNKGQTYKTADSDIARKYGY